MRVSLRWLQDYIDLKDMSVLELSATLTQLGLEVEGVETIQPLTGPVVVGQIKKAVQHPNADKLRLCDVDVGESEPLQIVCGAPNARDGLKVVVARVGSILPRDFKIKDSKIRGEASFGMLCSEQELGLSESHDGIIELPESAPIGAFIPDYLQLNDTVIEIGLTPNRSDCLGMIGLARDLAAKLDRPLKLPLLDAKRVTESLDSAAHVQVAIADPEACQRFVALYVRGVGVVPSPLWMQRRLQHAGMRPINLIVDATNYAMLENGQPVHAYDERDVKNRMIEVRRARAGETLITLDGHERTLIPTDIVIADAKNAIGLAGIMGGQNSEVKADTQNIIIEAAHFNASLIRKTAKRFALHTEASHRFERGIDIDHVAWVARRVADLIHRGASELKAEGVSVGLPEIAARLVDVQTEAKPARNILLRMSRLQKLTALTDVGAPEAKAILGRLGFRLLEEQGDQLRFAIPGWRQDMEREVDLIEEVARVHGYDKIPFKLPAMEIGTKPEHPLIEFTDLNKITLATHGLTEVISFPFMGAEDLAACQISAQHPLAAAVQLANPLVDQHRYLRTTMVPGLIHALQENQRHGIRGARLFEIARTFHEPRQLLGSLSPLWAHLQEQGDHVPTKARKDDRPIERTRAAGIFDQPYQEKSWQQAEIKTSFYHGKALLESYFASFGIDGIVYRPLETASEIPWMHPGATATLWTREGRYLGYLGELHPRTAKAYELDYHHATVAFEVDLEVILASSTTVKNYASGSIKFPPVTRDLALVVPTQISYADFERSFQNFKRRKHLRSQRLFDVYQGANIPEGKKSMAFSLQFHADDRTLTDKDVEKELENLLSWLREDLSAELR